MISKKECLKGLMLERNESLENKSRVRLIHVILTKIILMPFHHFREKNNYKYAFLLNIKLKN